MRASEHRVRGDQLVTVPHPQGSRRAAAPRPAGRNQRSRSPESVFNFSEISRRCACTSTRSAGRPTTTSVGTRRSTRQVPRRSCRHERGHPPNSPVRHQARDRANAGRVPRPVEEPRHEQAHHRGGGAATTTTATAGPSPGNPRPVSSRKPDRSEEAIASGKRHRPPAADAGPRRWPHPSVSSPAASEKSAPRWPCEHSLN